MIYGNDLTGASLSDDEVAHAYPWPESGPWVRAMMVTTLDGAAAGYDGVSGTVSSGADQVVFSAVRRYADVVLIGSGTLRAERYTPMRARSQDAARRAAQGQRSAPVVAIVSGSLELPWDLPLWSESTERPIVITPADADPDRLATAREHAEVITLPQVTPGALVGALIDRGLRRILCEGGPRLLRDLVDAGVVDEADITLTPLFAGTSASPTTTVLPYVATYRLAHVLQGDDTLMMRYLAPSR